MKNIYFLLFIFLGSCQQDNSSIVKTNQISASENKKSCNDLMLKHLKAVSERDLETLEVTLSPKGNMYLLLAQSDMITTVKGFMDYHVEWFKTDNWTFDTKIVSIEVKQDMAYAIVDAMYREPERNGKPYFNNMHISYVLEKMDGAWYVVKDHATSYKKTQ